MLLEKWIKKSGLSYREFARKIKIGEATIYNYIHLKRPPTLEIAIKIVKYTKNGVFYTDLMPTKEHLAELKLSRKKTQIADIFNDPDCF